MFKKPDESWRIVFSTTWEMDERSPAFDWIRLYAWGLSEIKMFRSKGEARRALSEIESCLWRRHWLRSLLGVVGSLGFGAAIFGWFVPIASQRGWGSIAMAVAVVLWILGGWCVFCAVVRGAVARDLRSKLASRGIICASCGQVMADVNGRLPNSKCPDCGVTADEMASP